MADIGYQEIDIDLLFEAEWNYKESHEELEGKLFANIEKNGVVQNLIVREVGEKFEVVNGNHRLKVVKNLGLETVMCYNLGQIDDLKAKRIAVETNETRFKSNPEKMSEVIESILTEFSPEDFDLTSPVTTAMLDQFKSSHEWRPPQPIEDAPFMEMGRHTDPEHDFICSKCKHRMIIYKSLVQREVVS